MSIPARQGAAHILPVDVRPGPVLRSWSLKRFFYAKKNREAIFFGVDRAPGPVLTYLRAVQTYHRAVQTYLRSTKGLFTPKKIAKRFFLASTARPGRTDVPPVDVWPELAGTANAELAGTANAELAGTANAGRSAKD